MIGATITMALGFLMLFHPQQNFTALWFAISLILATTSFSVISINFNTLGSLWSIDRVAKVRITSWREALGLVGLLIAAILPSILGLYLYSMVFVMLLASSSLVFMLWNEDHHKHIMRNEDASATLNINAVLDIPNVRFFVVYSISMLASAIPAVLVLFFIRDRLDAENLTGLFLLLYFLSGAAGMPLWQVIAKKTDKLKSWLLAMLIAVITFIWAYFLDTGDIWQYVLIFCP